MRRTNTAEYINYRMNNLRQLINEGVNGITKMDTLPNTALPLKGEAEAMYFRAMRDFFKTSVSHLIVDRNLDFSEEN